jgi:hypothetical protein
MARCAGLLILVFLIPLTSAHAAAPYVVGTWYGQGQPDDRDQMWLEHLLPNGGFDGLYRSCIKGKAQDLFQTGSWSLAGDVITIHIATVDGAPAPRTDLYRTLSRRGKTWTYRYLRLGFVYNAQRAADNFKLYSCEAVS